MDTDFRIETIRQIMDTPLTNTEKVVMTKFYFYAWEHDPESIPDTTELHSDVVVLPGMSGRAIGKITGVHESTANGAIKKCADYKLLNRKVDHVAVDAIGNPVQAQAMNAAKGDHWESRTTITLPLKLAVDRLAKMRAAADEDAAALATAEQARGRKNAKVNQGLIDLGRKLKEFTCPSCGATGEWALTCHKCGTTWETAEMLAGDQDIAKMPENPVTRNIRDTEKQPEIDPTPESGKTARISSNTRENRDTGESSTERGGDITRAIDAVVVQDDAGAPDRGAVGDPGDLAIGDQPAEVDDLAQGEIVQGADVVDFLAAGLGAVFCEVEKGTKKAINPCDQWGEPLNYLDYPLPGDCAAITNRMAGGGNIGILTGRGHLGIVDIDDHAGDFLALWPDLANQPLIYRDNAPDRVKVVVWVEDDDMKTHHLQGNGHKVDLLGRGAMAVIAGQHESGAVIRCRLPSNDLKVYKWSELEGRAEVFTNTPAARLSVSKVSTAGRLAIAGARPAGDMLRAALQWWMDDPSNRAQVDRLLAGCKSKGGFIAVRPDDRTPSTRASTDGFYKRTWRDFGTNETLDDFELYCRLTNTDKHTYKWQVVDDYRAAMGKPPLRKSTAKPAAMEMRA